MQGKHILLGVTGGIAATNIAKWDGSSWSALGLGMGSSVNALVVSGGNLDPELLAELLRV